MDDHGTAAERRYVLGRRENADAWRMNFRRDFHGGGTVDRGYTAEVVGRLDTKVVRSRRYAQRVPDVQLVVADASGNLHLVTVLFVVSIVKERPTDTVFRVAGVKNDADLPIFSHDRIRSRRDDLRDRRTVHANGRRRIGASARAVIRPSDRYPIIAHRHAGRIESHRAVAAGCRRTEWNSHPIAAVGLQRRIRSLNGAGIDGGVNNADRVALSEVSKRQRSH